MTATDYNSLDADIAPPPTDSARPLLIGMGLIAVIFFGLGGWAMVAPLDSAVVAPGAIANELNRRTVQHLEGGIISEILVTDGTVVKEGDVLIRLDPTRAKAQEEVVRGELDVNEAIEARLLAERDNLPAINLPQRLISRQSDPKVAEIIALQRSQFMTRRAALAGQRSILEQRIQQLEQQIIGTVALQRSKEQQIRYIAEELESLRDLVRDGHVTRTRYLSLERERSRLEGERGDHLASIARSQQAIGESKLQILQLEKERQQEVANQLRDIQSRVFELRERLVAAQDVLKRIDIVSPVSGTVINLAYVTVGGVISPGLPILSIVPVDDRMVVEAEIPPAEIDTVHAGQEVTVRLMTGGSKNIPVLKGKVESVSADRLSREARPDLKGGQVPIVGGYSYYLARISIPKQELAHLDGLQVYAGMPVEALISRGERTVMEYIMKPLTSSFGRAFKEQ